ncbi:carbonic anhydrase 14 [Cricetulus griseus]
MPGHLGEGTPQVTGFFEVTVAGKLVHSKKRVVTRREKDTGLHCPRFSPPPFAHELPNSWSPVYHCGDNMLFFAFLLKVTWILAADGGPHGQDHWPTSYPECGGNAQSPIDIQTDSVVFDPDLPAVQPHGYDQPGTEPLDLHNNGHTVQLSLPHTLHLGGLPRKYTAAQLHLHWGQKGSQEGSEHQINSEATAAELHVVHYDSESYGSLSEAAQKPQGLAVLGILIEVGEAENPAYDHILSHLHEIRHKDQTTSVPPFSVRELFPQQLDQFFRYNGSLTTPPCYQSVLWTVFNRKVQMSLGQLEKLQGTLFSTEEEGPEPLVQNYRVPQPLNQRTIFASFIPGDLQGSEEMGN